jgi:molybdenum cofactor synthesis domain-containing protein
MRPFTSTIPFAEARRRVLDAAAPTDRVERVALVDADGRVAAQDVTATTDVPPFDRAAMDGYAVRAMDTSGADADAAVALACVGRVLTGETPSRAVGAGECVEIATGAPMPEGADAVVMVEETTRRGDVVDVRTAVTRGQHVGPRGADIARGRSVVSAGQVLTPARVGALAATGVDAVDVYARPRVALASTGDEIVAPGQTLPPGGIYDVNRFTLAAVFARHGAIITPMPTVRDTIASLSAAFDGATGHDVLVLSGGSSVGDRDLTIDVMRGRGEVIFHGVSVRPGKPTLFGRVGSTMVFGLSGYPTSCLINAYLLVVQFLRRVARLPDWQPRSPDLPPARRVTSVAGRRQFYTVRVADGRAEPAFKASGDITSMANADGYIEIDEETEAVEAGTTVRVSLFEG